MRQLLLNSGKDQWQLLKLSFITDPKRLCHREYDCYWPHNWKVYTLLITTLTFVIDIAGQGAAHMSCHYVTVKESFPTAWKSSAKIFQRLLLCWWLERLFQVKRLLGPAIRLSSHTIIEIFKLFMQSMRKHNQKLRHVFFFLEISFLNFFFSQFIQWRMQGGFWVPSNPLRWTIIDGSDPFSTSELRTGSCHW